MALEYLSGIEWSPNGVWIAWSGGRKDRCDVGILKADGASSEQLTNAMYAGGRLAWSAEGGRLAFTSLAAGKSPETYIVTLAGTDRPAVAAQPASDPARARLSAQLLDMLRRETALVLKSGKL
jgi:Tol biopolymer transport system component